MALSKRQKQHIQDVIKSCLRNKFQNYNPESNNMPFHYRLLGKDRMALYSLMQSLLTTFGASIFEPAAGALAKDRFVKATAQYILGSKISENCQQAIQKIMNNLTIGGNPDKTKEIELLRESITRDKINELKTVKADLFLEKNFGEIFLFDLKTVKPNLGDFKDFKRMLLE